MFIQPYRLTEKIDLLALCRWSTEQEKYSRLTVLFCTTLSACTVYLTSYGKSSTTGLAFTVFVTLWYGYFLNAPTRTNSPTYPR